MADSDAARSVQKLDLAFYRIAFDARIYSQLAVKKAAYKFAADFATLFSVGENGDITANIEFAKETSEADQPMLIRAFLNEVIDQDLREHIARQTEPTRNLILAEAFSKTSILHEEG
jgi:His-Xaa-Ser system protein HxsD